MKIAKKLKRNIAILNVFKILYTIKSKDKFFFFPYYHIGGAERVHIDILSVFPKKGNLCFITNSSKNSGLKKQFKSSSQLIYLGKLIKTPLKKVTLKVLALSINKKKNAVVFGCNSYFFYELVPLLKDHISTIDLIHAFADDGIEVHSLSQVNKLTKRVVLGKKTFSDFENLYSKSGIDINLLDRIKIIRNKVSSINKNITIQKNSRFTILFVGRDSEEKRFHLFLEIANSFKNNQNVAFIVIGGFNKKKYSYLKNIEFVGEIYDNSKINQFYAKSHLILITSRREGLPMVILEAMVYGVVPLSTDVGEIPEVISKASKTGILISNELPESEIVAAFNKTILEFIENPNYLNEFSQNVQKVVSSEYSEGTFNKKYQELFLI